MFGDPNFDVGQWLFRLGIVVVGVSLGVVLALLEKKHSKRLAIVQILLSVCVPILCGCYISWRRINGLAGYVDLEQIAEEIRMIQYGHTAPLILVGLYITLIASTTLTIQRIIVLRSHHK